MDDDAHMYDVVGYQEGGYRSSNKIESVTCTSFNDRQNYMMLSGQHGGSSEYQELQLCTADPREAVDTRNDEVKGSSDCYLEKDELRQIKICLGVLSFLAVILFLMTISALGLAAYGIHYTGSTTSLNSQVQKASLEGVVDSTDFVTNHSFTLFKDQSTQEMTQILGNLSSISTSLRNMVIHLESRMNTTDREVINLMSLRATVDDVESRLNTINSGVESQRTFINTLESRFNTTNARVTSLRTLVNNLNSQLREIESTTRTSVNSLQNQLNTNVSSLQLALRSQPSKQGYIQVQCMFSQGSYNNVCQPNKPSIFN